MAGTAPNNSRGWVWVVLALVVAGALFLVLRSGHDETPVRAAVVERHDLVSSISTNGKVEPIDDYEAYAPGPGTVEKLMVDVGQSVVKGQELLKLDSADAESRVASARASVAAGDVTLNTMKHGGTPAELEAAKSDLNTAEQQLAAATSQLNTVEALAARGDASAAEVANARQRVTDLSARVADLKARNAERYSAADIAAQSAANRANMASLQAAQSSYAGVDIRAPFAGTVYSLPVNEFDSVKAGDALIDIANLKKLQVRAYFDEPEIGKLAMGEPVKIVWDAKPNLVWHGHIIQPPTTIISYAGTRNVGECLISVDDANGDLLPNTNVTVTVTTSMHSNVLSVPREALRTEGLTNFVYRIVGGKLVRTVVQVGVVNLTRVEITGGLNQGDQVALGATTEAELSNGLRVKVQSQQ